MIAHFLVKWAKSVAVVPNPCIHIVSCDNDNIGIVLLNPPHHSSNLFVRLTDVKCPASKIQSYIPGIPPSLVSHTHPQAPYTLTDPIPSSACPDTSTAPPSSPSSGPTELPTSPSPPSSQKPISARVSPTSAPKPSECYAQFYAQHADLLTDEIARLERLHEGSTRALVTDKIKKTYKNRMFASQRAH